MGRKENSDEGTSAYAGAGCAELRRPRVLAEGALIPEVAKALESRRTRFTGGERSMRDEGDDVKR